MCVCVCVRVCVYTHTRSITPTLRSRLGVLDRITILYIFLCDVYNNYQSINYNRIKYRSNLFKLALVWNSFTTRLTERFLSVNVRTILLAVIYNICEEWDLDFSAMYSCTGLWNSFFLLIYSVSGASRLMKWSTR